MKLQTNYGKVSPGELIERMMYDSYAQFMDEILPDVTILVAHERAAKLFNLSPERASRYYHTYITREWNHITKN